MQEQSDLAACLFYPTLTLQNTPRVRMQEASWAFMLRNAVDIGSTHLARLPLAKQRCLLSTAGHFVLSEFARRFTLSVGMKREGFARLADE